MSYTEIYAVDSNGDVRLYGEVKNSFAGAMHVWNALNTKYDLGDSFITQFERTWGKFNEGFYERYEDIVLGSTFDGAMVKKEHLDELIQALDAYHVEHGNSNHRQQAELLSEVKNQDILAVAWCQTSVVSDMWDYDFDEELDEIIPYNISKGSKHWYLFDDLKEEN